MEDIVLESITLVTEDVECVFHCCGVVTRYQKKRLLSHEVLSVLVNCPYGLGQLDAAISWV